VARERGVSRGNEKFRKGVKMTVLARRGRAGRPRATAQRSCGPTTHTPRPGTVLTSPSARSTSNAFMTVFTAIPCCWLSVLADGSGVRGGYCPELMPARSRSASCWYAGRPVIGSIMNPA